MHKPRFFSLATGVAFLVSLLSVPHGAAQGHRTAKGHVIVEPTGPMAVFDTSSGRVVCRLYSKQAPITTANFIALAQGKKDWADASSVVQQGKPFYDGT